MELLLAVMIGTLTATGVYLLLRARRLTLSVAKMRSGGDPF